MSTDKWNSLAAELAKSGGQTKNTDKVRITVDISPALYQKLDELANAIHGTKSEVLRRAIALMDVAVKAKEQGKKIGLAEQDQPLATEIIIG
jgi:predicted transcriptional regulator